MTTPTSSTGLPFNSRVAIQGRYIWYELLTPNPEAAQRFYGAVAGWSVQSFESPDPAAPPYQIFVGPTGGLGGIFRMEGPTQWLAYIAVDDCDAATKRVAALGGTVHRDPSDIPTVGRFSVVADPSGATFYLMTPIGERTPWRDPVVGEISWNEVLTGDADTAMKKFYSPLLGWEEMSRMDMGPQHGPYILYGQGGAQYGGMMRKPAELQQGAFHFYIRVHDVAAAMERVKAAGGTVRNGPMEVPGGSLVALCFDSQGAAFALHEVK